MSRLPASVSPDALRQFMAIAAADKAAAARRFASIELQLAALAGGGGGTSGPTDNQPRSVTVPIDFTAFSGTPATTVTITILTGLPAGVAWTHVWIEPMVTFQSVGVSLWRLQVLVPPTGSTAGGAPKSVDVTTPDALAQQAASWYMQTDSSSSVNIELQIDSGGIETADQLTQGTALVHLVIYVPGSNADTLPHS